MISLLGQLFSLEELWRHSTQQWSAQQSIVTALLLTSVSQGGIRAVIWTDVFQSIVMLGGLLTMIIMGTVHMGGPGTVFHRAHNGSRLDVLKYVNVPICLSCFIVLTVCLYLYDVVCSVVSTPILLNGCHSGLFSLVEHLHRCQCGELARLQCSECLHHVA